MREISPRVLSQIFILTVMLLLGMLIFREMLPYFSGVLGAITLYVMLRKPMVTLVRKKMNKNLAAGILLLFSLVVIVIPFSGLVAMLGSKIGQAIQNSEKVIAAVKEQLSKLEAQYNLDLASEINTGEISSWVSGGLQNFAGSTMNVFMSLAIMYFLLFYMLVNRGAMRESLYDYLPISRDNIKILGKKIIGTVRSNAIGIPLVAIVQGVIALIGFFIFGTPDPWFWFVITTVGSMIPFVGTLLGIVPVFILSLSAGDNFAAWGILIYGLVVVGSMDNIVRLFVLKRLDDVHPLVTLIGVIIGVPLFGFIGLIFGPLLISLFVEVVNIYRQEFGFNNNEQLALNAPLDLNTEPDQDTSSETGQ